MNNGFNITCRVVVLLGIAIALLPDRCDAAFVYNLVDYPDLQNGYTVSGTITVSDGAPEDGLLATEEILDWEWEVSIGLEVITGQLHPIEPDSSSLTDVVGIEIDSQGVYLPHEFGRIFKLESNTNINSRGENSRRFAWFSGNSGTPSRYVFNVISGIREGNIFQAWGADLPANPDRWLIATRVPEPSTASFTIIAILYGAFNRHAVKVRRSAHQPMEMY